ncbi:MAG: hypothetical protein ACR2PZ_08185 [Pseudomonadales bacterium]
MTYSVVARNFSEAHDNKIHSDEIAKKYGFLGALVPGVAVFGHLVHPLVSQYGERWLSQSLSNVRFAKPAYHGDQLTIEHALISEQDRKQSREWRDVAFSDRSQATARDEVISTLDSALPEQLPQAIEVAWNQHGCKPAGRPEMNWDNVVPHQPYQSWEWHIDAQSNRTAAEEVADDSSIYAEFVHPHLILSSANGALTREYMMPAWIHVGSELCLRSALRVGDRVTVRAMPLEKWERKGHQFLRLYLSYHRGGELTTEIVHTAIFRVAQ